MTKFIHGLKLNKMFYREVVGPLMQEHFPGLIYSAGLVGHGSDVLGFDSEKSMDHNWGPHLQLFFSEADFIACKNSVDHMFHKKLPYTFKGFSTHFIQGDRYKKNTPRIKKSGDVNHLFDFYTPRSFFIKYLGFDIEKKITYQDWLLFPQQALIEVTKGELFHDGLKFQNTRQQFSYFPDDIWKYMMRVQWGKLIDELQTQARTGEEGDFLGSMVVTARTVQKIMFLCFLIDRKYAPYSKWFGTAFQQWLKSSKFISPLIEEIMNEKNWLKRQKLLAKTYQKLARMHNKLGITKPLTTKIIDFYGRGYPIIDVWEYVQEIEKSIKKKQLRNMRYPLGSIDQFIDHARLNQMDYFYRELKDVIQ